MAIHNEGIRQGIMMYPGTGSADGKKGDHLIISPPYNTTDEEISLIVATAAQVIDSAFTQILRDREALLRG